jgi:hypothetical protein
MSRTEVFYGSVEKKEVERAINYAKNNPDKQSKYYLCLVNTKGDDVSYKSYWNIYTEEQQGYKEAVEKHPYFYKEDENNG